ncbi:hypothetical protein F4778DRAFT_748386 [Xylariomycetidae sp. FL2044]|nr:hypothetical protein F4778DRAFT_748386 [Xylariomycetidae sp. FL2044]
MQYFKNFIYMAVILDMSYASPTSAQELQIANPQSTTPSNTTGISYSKFFVGSMGNNGVGCPQDPTFSCVADLWSCHVNNKFLVEAKAVVTWDDENKEWGCEVYCATAKPPKYCGYQ